MHQSGDYILVFLPSIVSVNIISSSDLDSTSTMNVNNIQREVRTFNQGN